MSLTSMTAEEYSRVAKYAIEKHPSGFEARIALALHERDELRQLVKDWNQTACHATNCQLPAYCDCGISELRDRAAALLKGDKG